MMCVEDRSICIPQRLYAASDALLALSFIGLLLVEFALLVSGGGVMSLVLQHNVGEMTLQFVCGEIDIGVSFQHYKRVEHGLSLVSERVPIWVLLKCHL